MENKSNPIIIDLANPTKDKQYEAPTIKEINLLDESFKGESLENEPQNW